MIAVARSTAFSGLRKITDAIKPEAAGAKDAPAPDGQDAPDSPNGRAPRRKSTERPPSAASLSAVPAEGVIRDRPAPRRFSRHAHRQRFHDSPSGDGR